MKELLVSMFQYCSWPLVALILFWGLRQELSGLLSRLRSVKAGKVELQLSEQILNQGFTKEQLSAITKLNADDIDIFLLVSFTDHPGFTYTTGMPYERFKDCLQRIQEAGLIRITAINDSSSNILHEQTPAGRRMRSLLVNSSVSLLRLVE